MRLVELVNLVVIVVVQHDDVFGVSLLVGDSYLVLGCLDGDLVVSLEEFVNFYDIFVFRF